MSEQLQEREKLLAEAAGLIGPGLPVGDPVNYLHSYYRHVDTADLEAAGAERVAAAAAGHAEFAANRPHGRALVSVQSGLPGTLCADRDVIDVVTDDMPFLIDTITMILASQGIDTELVVHPQLLVRRDVSGALREVLHVIEGPQPLNRPRIADTEGAPDEIAESWSHIEVARLADGKAQALKADLERALRDVRLAVEDFPKMKAMADQLAGQLATERDAEVEMLLRWLEDAHFTFLGYREYELLHSDGMPTLRGVPGTGLGILRYDRPGETSLADLPPRARDLVLNPDRRLLVTKANSRATVHRPNYLDYIGVKRLSADGQVTGEYRFLGLFTHVAYSDSITRIPVLRRTLAEVLAVSGVPADSHDGRDLAEFMEAYPRDELFQTPVTELAEVAAEVLKLRERPRTRLFLRTDTFGRYVSCLIYLSRDRYTTKVRLGVQEVLRRELRGSQLDFSAIVDERPMARLHVVVRPEPGQLLAEADPGELERKIAAKVRSWDDDLFAEAVTKCGDASGRALLAEFADAIPETFKTDVPARAAISDLEKVRDMRRTGDDISFEMWESASYVGGAPAWAVEEAVRRNAVGVRPRVWRLTIHRTGSPITLTDVLPRLQHMGVDVVDEHPYEFSSVPPFWIYDFGLRHVGAAQVRLDDVREQIEGALGALWRGEIEDDAFNALVLDAGLTWQQIAVLRAYAKYLRQAGTRFSQDYIADVLRSNPAIARLLIRLFESRFNPDRTDGEAERSEALVEEITGKLDEVVSLDEDRILRAYLGLILATVRTSYFRAESGRYLVFKMNAAAVPDLPAPRPRFELFVYSPRFEAVHLRFASVARGGIRWSERREDFRTEVLGLAKAQEVKNSVIVPSGAKGGFVCKQLPDPADRDAHAAEVRGCYKEFIAAMLDVTDNLSGGEVVPPERVVRHDGDDPYLVVAADKGTATFSDTANEISLRRRFWLGDAFASGGSAGYDHKKMGITARGAWESVKYHFQALGVDIATTDFTVAGVGDMSGDVFGNGMLLSEHIKMVAAFDHRHVFVDPDPDPKASFAERRRMFDLPRSSWADYDATLISAGGGVWPRSAKSVPVSPQAAAALGIEASVTALSPDQLISAILAAPVDLLWNGGIGTYIKASTQSHADVGDRSNDGVRVDATQVRARVIGEGGNLGLTQAARIEYALAGGLVNTDFIDNSAGVDTSDHEVNIKILLDGVVRDGEMTTAARNDLLQQMTDEVGGLVLAHNYQQNRVLAASRAQAAPMLHVHARYIRKLERDGRIKRHLDGLPGEKEIADRRAASVGLTAPEFSILLAQTKISTGQEMLSSELPDEPYLRRVLREYFPAVLTQQCGDRMTGHRLHREIITTTVVNDMVDRSGITFVFRLSEETGATVPHITEAWLVAREVFDMAGFWRQLEALDGQVSASAQVLAALEGRKLTERATRWLLQFRRPPFDIEATIRFFADGVPAIADGLPGLLAGSDLTVFEQARDDFAGYGFPQALAERIAGMVPAYSAFDIVQIASQTGLTVAETAEVYFDLADRLQIARLRDRITALPRDDRWNTMARGAMRDDLYAAHAALAKAVLKGTGAGSPEQRLAAWVARNDAAVARAAQTLSEIWESDAFTVATLSVAVRAIRTLVSASILPA